MREEIHFKIYRILLFLFAFAMPFATPTLSYWDISFGIVTPIILTLFMLNWVIEADFKAKFKRIKEKKLIFPFIAITVFYGLYLIGMTYSSNLDFGGKDILLKLPFVLFPLLLFTMNPAVWKPKMVQNLLYTFAMGCLLALFISLGNSFILCKEDVFSVEYFHYVNASLFFHPSYASMYYCFSFVIILYLLINNQLPAWKRITTWLMFLLFPAEIVMLDSRTGQMAFVAAIIAFAFYVFIFNRKKSLRFTLYMGLLASILITSSLLLPYNRLFANIQQLNIEKVRKDNLNADVESGRVNSRMQVWLSAIEMIKERPAFGVGTGDVKDALLEKYVQNDFSISERQRLNAHNQYLQVAVTLGLGGLAVFLALLGSIFWTGWKKRNVLFFLFGLIVAVNFVTESMLERQVGVMFFTFFFALLHYVARKDLIKNE